MKRASTSKGTTTATEVDCYAQGGRTRSTPRGGGVLMAALPTTHKKTLLSAMTIKEEGSASEKESGSTQGPGAANLRAPFVR